MRYKQKYVLALEAHLGAELHRRSTELTRAWLDRLMERLDYLCSGSDLGSEEMVRKEFETLGDILVFEQFVRAHPGVADGTGLGLSIARTAVEQIGGDIWLESEPGAGTTFYLTVVDPPLAGEPGEP